MDKGLQASELKTYSVHIDEDHLKFVLVIRLVCCLYISLSMIYGDLELPLIFFSDFCGNHC